MLDLRRISPPLIVQASGLILREWTRDDSEILVTLFDTDEMNRWTPLEFPFDLPAAERYIEAAHRGRRDVGALQLAITEDGSNPLGELLIFPTAHDHIAELAYAVGAPFQGRGLARRAVDAAASLVAGAGGSAVRLTIATDNIRSQRVAAATGFHATIAPATERRRKGLLLTMRTWERQFS